MKDITQKMEELLVLLEVNKATKQKFLKAASQFASKDQYKLLQFLMLQLETLNATRSIQLKGLKKFLKDQKWKFENEEKEESLKKIETTLNSL